MPLSDAQRVLRIVDIQIDALSSTCQYQDECKALSQLLQATSGILQYWQENSIQDAKVKSAGQLLRFALDKVAKVSAACSVEASELGASTAAPAVDVPAEATSAAADIQLAVSALATALQWDQASQHNKLRLAGRPSQHLSTAAQMAGMLATVHRCSEAGSLTAQATANKAAHISNSGTSSAFGSAAAAAAGSSAPSGRRANNSSNSGSAQQRARAPSFGAKSTPGRQPRNSGPPKEVSHQQDHTVTGSSSSTDGQGACCPAGEDDKSVSPKSESEALPIQVDCPASMTLLHADTPDACQEAPQSETLSQIEESATDFAMTISHTAGTQAGSDSSSHMTAEAGADSPAAIGWQATQPLKPGMNTTSNHGTTSGTSSSHGTSAEVDGPSSHPSTGSAHGHCSPLGCDACSRPCSQPGSSTAAAVNPEAARSSVTVQAVLVPGTRWSLAAGTEGFVCEAMQQGSFLQVEAVSTPCSAGICTMMADGSDDETERQQPESDSAHQPQTPFAQHARSSADKSTVQDVQQHLDLINSNVLLQSRRPSQQQQQRQQRAIQGRKSVPAATCASNSQPGTAQYRRQASNSGNSLSSASSNASSGHGGDSRGSSAGSSRRSSRVSSCTGGLDAAAAAPEHNHSSSAQPECPLENNSSNTLESACSHSSSAKGSMHDAATASDTSPGPAAHAAVSASAFVSAAAPAAAPPELGHDAQSVELYAEPYRLLQAGNAAYTACQYAAAAKLYQSAMDALQDMGAGPAALNLRPLNGSDSVVKAESAAAVDGMTAGAAQQQHAGGVLLWLKCCLNLACCHLRLGHAKQCVAQCDGLLEVNPNNVVALCHRGRALLMLQQHSAARADLTAALGLLQSHEDGCSAHGGSSLVSHMELNSSYWQQRIHGLLASLPADH